MKLCDNGCYPLCDFCVFYRDNVMNDCGELSEDGDCILYGKETYASAGYECDGFRCFDYDVLERL